MVHWKALREKTQCLNTLTVSDDTFSHDSQTMKRITPCPVFASTGFFKNTAEEDTHTCLDRRPPGERSDRLMMLLFGLSSWRSVVLGLVHRGLF